MTYMYSIHLAHLNSSIIYIQNIHKQKGHEFSSLLYWLHLTTASGKALLSHTLKCLWFNQVFVGGVWESLGDGGTGAHRQSIFFTHTQHPLTPQWLAHCLGTQGKTFTIYYLFPPALSLWTNTQHRCIIMYNNKSHYTYTHLCKSARSHKIY